MASKSKVYFFFNKPVSSLRDREAVKKHIESLFRKERKTLNKLNYIFCSDWELLKINRQYLGHDYYTDIVTFDLSEDRNIVGEIYISIDRVKENASRLDENIKSEILRVMLHGALHLCGYNDKTESDKLKMKRKEDYYLQLYLVSRRTVSA